MFGLVALLVEVDGFRFEKEKRMYSAQDTGTVASFWANKGGLELSVTSGVEVSRCSSQRPYCSVRMKAPAGQLRRDQLDFVDGIKGR